MNREIKFRAWDGEEMVILTQAGIQFFDFEGSYAMSFVVDGYSGFWAHECYDKRKCDFPIMQYTGLKDKNGKDIYEDDIISTPKGVTAVTFDSGCFYTYLVSRYRLGGWNEDSIEILGNIYENPELLTINNTKA